MKRIGFIALVAALAVVGVGCSSDKTDSSTAPAGNGGSGGSAQDSGGDPTPKDSCVRPGDKGNAIGVGEYCTPLGKQCAAFPTTAPLCLADVGQTQWFCTRAGCSTDDQCGAGAFCLHNPAGTACVLDRCEPKDAQ